MLLKQKQNVEWLQFENLSKHVNLIHGFTTRNGGVSHPPFSSLNMGRFTDDCEEDVLENYNRILSALGINDRPRYMTKQVHSDLVHHVDKHDQEAFGAPEPFETFIEAKDGLITSRSDVNLITYYADCVPLFIYDPVNHVGGVVHSGWKGTSKRIGMRAVERLSELFGSNPTDLIIGIGPCASVCCYEVGEDVIDLFNWMHEDLEHYLEQSTESHYLIDLKGINKHIFELSGVQAKNIEISNFCTMCNTDMLFSYRKEKPLSGRMSAIFALK